MFFIFTKVINYCKTIKDKKRYSEGLSIRPGNRQNVGVDFRSQQFPIYLLTLFCQVLGRIWLNTRFCGREGWGRVLSCAVVQTSHCKYPVPFTQICLYLNVKVKRKGGLTLRLSRIELFS